MWSICRSPSIVCCPRIHCRVASAISSWAKRPRFNHSSFQIFISPQVCEKLRTCQSKIYRCQRTQKKIILAVPPWSNNRLKRVCGKKNTARTKREMWNHSYLCNDSSAKICRTENPANFIWSRTEFWPTKWPGEKKSMIARSRQWKTESREKSKGEN